MNKDFTKNTKLYSFNEIKNAIKAIGTKIRVGCYDMPEHVYFIGLNHYLDYNEDILKEYDKITYHTWDIGNVYFSDIEDEYIFNNEGFWDINTIITPQQLNSIKCNIENTKRYISDKNSYKQKRQQANSYTARKKIREKVFDINGRICIKCKSRKNLTLDHIVPVSKGGENYISNLQVLCKSCNSKKNNKENKSFMEENNE